MKLAGMYTNSDNRVVLELLTPMMPLLNYQHRQPHLMEALARVLAALSIAVCNLIGRIEAATPARQVLMPYGCKGEVTLSSWQRYLQQQKQQARAALGGFAEQGVKLEAWLKAVRLNEQQLQHAAQAREADDGKALPYCLWAQHDLFNPRLSNMQQLQLQPDIASRSLLFTGESSGSSIMLKVVPSRYPNAVGLGVCWLG